MRDSIIASLAAPALLCIKVNTSYADPPKMQQRLSLSHEIHCGAVLLSPGSRTSAASLADSRGLRCVLAGSAQIEVGLTGKPTFIASLPAMVFNSSLSFGRVDG
jgi:hypothetical protein